MATFTLRRSTGGSTLRGGDVLREVAVVPVVVPTIALQAQYDPATALDAQYDPSESLPGKWG